MNGEIAIFLFFTKEHFLAIAFGVVFLAVAFLMARRKPVKSRTIAQLFPLYIIIIAFNCAFLFALYWVEWHKPECGIACRYFFPPYSHYYFNEVLVRLLSTFAFHAGAGLSGGILFSLFARATKGRIIDQVDVDLLTVGGMVAGWPNIFLFYAVVFVATVAMTVIRAIAEKSANIRMIITPMLPYAAALVAVFGNELARMLHFYDIGLTLF